ncbi:pyridoxal phosphate-dependent class II aminotransferase [Puteibacter caeruleilacunae]|nr:pyridoxal phosphate-dependent class II aminotransferase [Puteibacter caeruleilacunae]
MIYGHGDDGYRYGSKIRKDFSSNISPLTDHTRLKSYLSGKLECISNYPEPAADKLAEKIAAMHGVNPKNILVTNGATEAFYLIASAWAKKRSAIVVPTFSEYEDSCKIFRHKLSFISEDEFSEDMELHTDLLWVCNPNNPTGKCYSKDFLLNYVGANENRLHIIDEAYGDLCRKQETLIKFVDDHSNLLIVRSLTKNFSIPGLRLGYIVGCEELINQVKQFKMPWSVNSLAIEAGLFLVSNNEDHSVYWDMLVRQSQRLQEEMSKIDGIEVIPSDVNYFLLKLTKGSAIELKKYLIDKCGILIREASNFRDLDERYFRIAVQDRKSNLELVEAVKVWLNMQQ